MGERDLYFFFVLLVFHMRALIKCADFDENSRHTSLDLGEGCVYSVRKMLHLHLYYFKG